MGIGLELDPSHFFKAEEKRYSLLESVPRGLEMGTDKLTSYAQSMKLVFTKEGAKSVGGFGSIGSIFRRNGTGLHSGTSQPSFLWLLLS